ncbi:MAG: OadG family protein [Firmicutes bacterium]|nr:OadG family protein [Bacillota bacterium]
MEKIEFAIQVMVIGFAVVMFTLLLLYGLLHLFNLIFTREKKGKNVTGAATTEAAPVNKDFDNKRITAAIIAAVYQYMQGNNLLASAGRISFNVKPSESRTGDNWQITGRRVLLQNRMELETIRRKKHHENI